MPADADNPAAVLPDIERDAESRLRCEIELRTIGWHIVGCAEHAASEVAVEGPAVTLEEVPLKQQVQTGTKGVLGFLRESPEMYFWGKGKVVDQEPLHPESESEFVVARVQDINSPVAGDGPSGASLSPKRRRRRRRCITLILKPRRSA